MKARFGTRLILIIVAVFLLLFSIVTLYVGIRSNGIALDKETVDVLKELQEAEKPDIGAAGYWTVMAARWPRTAIRFRSSAVRRVRIGC